MSMLDNELVGEQGGTYSIQGDGALVYNLGESSLGGGAESRNGEGGDGGETHCGYSR